MSFYEKLGVARVINCFGTYTLIGGAILSQKVRTAMEEADKNFTWMWELEKKAGERVAELTGAEAAFITPGAFAALAMSAAACMAGNDPDKMSILPDTSGMKNEFIIQRCLRDFKYDRSMTIAGGKLVEVGDELKGCASHEIEAAITEKTAGIHHMAHGATGDFASPKCNIVPLKKVIEIAHKHGIPVIVDAAFQCYPINGFKKYVEMGADLIAYSCKYFRGPNTAGLLIGRKDLIDAVALHSFVGQEGGPGGEIYLEAKPDQLHGSVFRGCKLDRSSVIGAVVSLEEYLATNFDDVIDEAHGKVGYLKSELMGIKNISVKIFEAGSVEDEPVRVSIQIILKNKTPKETSIIVKKLLEGNPPIWVSCSGNRLIINVTSFRGLPLFSEDDLKIVAERLKKILSQP